MKRISGLGTHLSVMTRKWLAVFNDSMQERQVILGKARFGSPRPRLGYHHDLKSVKPTAQNTGPKSVPISHLIGGGGSVT